MLLICYVKLINKYNHISNIISNAFSNVNEAAIKHRSH